MSNHARRKRRGPGKAGGGVKRAEFHTPTSTAAGMTMFDPTSTTYNVFGAATSSTLGLTAGEAPRPLVLADLTGKWNHGAHDELTLMLAPEVAREWAQILTQCADAAERDLAAYLRGLTPDRARRPR